MVQFLPMPAIAYPQNAMINFAPMNQSLQFMAQNNMDRARFGLQQNADLREQDMHPLRMDQTRAQTAGLWGQERRAETMLPLQMDQTRAQTGLTRAQTGLTGVQAAAARDANLRAQDLHVPALGMANNNLASSNLDRDQRVAALLAQATTPQQHQMIVGALRARRIPIPTGLETWQGSQQGAANIAGPALTQAQFDQERLRRLNPLNDVEDRMAAAARLGWDPSRPPTPFQMYGLTGQAPQPQQLPAQALPMIDESVQAINSGNNAVQSLTQALQLSSQAYAGPTAGIRGTVTGTLGGQAGQATMQFNQLMQSQALEQLKAIFGAAPTEGERRILLDIQGSANQPQAVRDAIIRRAIQAAEARIRFHTERVTSLRNGSYFTPQGMSVQQPGQQGGPQTTTADQINGAQVGQVVIINGQRFRRAADGGFNRE